MEESNETMPSCCGYDSRIASRRGNIYMMLMLVVVSICFTFKLNRLNDENMEMSTPKDEERIHLKMIMSVTMIQIIVNSLAIWGTTTYRRWPVIVGLGWIFVSLILLTLGTVYAAIFPFGASGLSVLAEETILLQLQFFLLLWPMYEYIQEYEKLKTRAAIHEMEPDAKQNLLETV